VWASGDPRLRGAARDGREVDGRSCAAGRFRIRTRVVAISTRPHAAGIRALVPITRSPAVYEPGPRRAGGSGAAAGATALQHREVRTDQPSPARPDMVFLLVVNTPTENQGHRRW